MIEPELNSRAVGASNSTRMRPLLITCLSIVVAGLLFVGGLGIGFAAGKWSDAPDATAQDEGAAASLRARFPLFWEAIDILYRDFYGELPASDEATYAAIRGVDAFDLVLDGIRAVRAGGLPVTTRTTVQRANYAEIPLIIEVTKSADVNTISFLTVDVSNPHAFGSRLIPVEQQLPPTALLPDDVLHLERLLAEIEVRFAEDFASHRIAESPDKLRQMIAYFRALYDETARSPVVRCNAPHLSTVIEVDGSLRPCYFLPTMGSLKIDALPQAINGAEAIALRRAYRKGERPECERCVCPLYKGGRALLQL